ncbi:17911_t:CDS:1, partial [Cetraspora pellucida]
ALFHVHTCKDKNCKLLPDNTEHIFKNISTHYFDKSFETFPVPSKDNITPKTTYLLQTIQSFNQTNNT